MVKSSCYGVEKEVEDGVSSFNVAVHGLVTSMVHLIRRQCICKIGSVEFVAELYDRRLSCS